MDDRLIGAYLTRTIETPWGSQAVRPPTVREALTLLTSYKGVLEDSPVNAGVFFEVLSGWLPRKMYEVMVKSQRDVVVKFVFDLVNSGVPEFHRDTENRYVGGGGWASLLTEFLTVFSYTDEQVMQMSWPAFLVYAANIGQVHAREILQALRIKGIQYTQDDGKRNKEINALVATANYPQLTEEARQAIKDKEQADVLNAMSAMYAYKDTKNHKN